MDYSRYKTRRLSGSAHINTDFAFEVRVAPRIVVSTHEAGHLAGFEAEGMGAGRAKVYMEPARLGQPAFWSGSATTLGGLQDDCATPTTPKRRMQEAVAMLCGRAAEVAIGNAGHLGTPLEVVNAIVWATEGGKETGLSMAEAIAVLVNRTARIVHGHHIAIETMAKRLDQRGIVTYRDRRIAQALKAIRAAPQVRCTPAQVHLVASLIPSEAVTMAKHVLAGTNL